MRSGDTVWLGWFGPIGIAALYDLTYLAQKGVQDMPVWAAGSLVVTASTLAHGMTTLPGRRAYQRLTVDDEAGHISGRGSGFGSPQA